MYTTVMLRCPHTNFGRTVSNLPYTIAAADLRLAMLGAFPSLIDIDV
ncbi:hypothetical protein AaE_001704, partial [Aphanomyces astaci]